MYLFENMLDSALRDGDTWTTPDHRIVAANALLGNPLVKCMEDLVNNVKIINAIPVESIRSITGKQLIAAGCYI